MFNDGICFFFLFIVLDKRFIEKNCIWVCYIDELFLNRDFFC